MVDLISLEAIDPGRAADPEVRKEHRKEAEKLSKRCSAKGLEGFGSWRTACGSEPAAGTPSPRG